MSTERRIKSLKLRLKSLVTSLNLIKTFVDGFDEETQADEVPVRLESLIRLWSDYNTVQSELETLDETAIEAHLKERTSLESIYYRVKGFLLAHNKTQLNQSLNSPSQLDAQFPPSASQVRLPDVKLPVFDGKLENWLNFHDLFVSLVHSSVGLSNIQKFYYLRSSLSSAALQLIQTIPISAHNYPVAWNLLLEHFQNPARLKQSYVDTLFDFASIKRESATELHSLVEKFEANVRVLQQLGERTEYWDILLIRMLSTRLDPTTRRDWEEYSSTKTAITFKDLTSFIQRRVTVLQSIQAKTIEAQPPPVQKKPAQRSVSTYGATQVNPRKCVVCSDHHPLYMCERFSQLSLDEKESEIRRLHLCRNCLRKGHLSKECLSSSNCRRCRGRHHTQLCPISSTTSEPQSTTHQPSNAVALPQANELPTTSASATIAESVCNASAGRLQNSILLATAVIFVVDDDGTKHVARALLDSGSECCFITESFSQRIKAQRKKICLPITGIGQASTQAKLKFTSTIRSRVGEYSTNIEFLVLPKLTIDLPTATFDASLWQIPPGVHLADPSFHETKQVDVVIGAEIFFELFKVPGRIPLGDSLPTLVNSVLGWIVSGKISHGTPAKSVVSNVALVADQHRFKEHLCTIVEDATPSSAFEQASCEEQFHCTLNSMEQHTHRLTDYDRTSRTSTLNLANATIEEKDSTESTILHPTANPPAKPLDNSYQGLILSAHAPSATIVRTADEKQLHIVRQFLVAASRSWYWLTGARKLSRTTIYIKLQTAHNKAARQISEAGKHHRIETAKKLLQQFRWIEYQLANHRDSSYQGFNMQRHLVSLESSRNLYNVATRSAQNHFIRVFGNHTLQQDDEETLLTRIDFRSFVSPSDEPPEFQSPLPDHFATEFTLTISYTTVPPKSPSSHLLHQQKVQKMFQLTWICWHVDAINWSSSRIIDVNPDTTGGTAHPFRFPRYQVDPLHKLYTKATMHQRSAASEISPTPSYERWFQYGPPVKHTRSLIIKDKVSTCPNN